MEKLGSEELSRIHAMQLKPLEGGKRRTVSYNEEKGSNR
jgi:hypothetical protein